MFPISKRAFGSSFLVGVLPLLILLIASNCVRAEDSIPAAKNDGKKIVVCSTTQIADFARNIVGDQWEVKCVLGPGQDPHSYKPTAADSRDVAGADLCLENGWNLEGHGWMRTLAKNSQRPIRTCVQGVTPLQTEDATGEVKDPHAWMDPENAWVYVKNIRDGLSAIDPDNAELFASRANLYRYQLKSLKVWIGSEVNKVPLQRRILVSHHDAFGYFCQAFKFEARSPQGWSTAELKGVSPTKQKEIAQMIRDEGVKSIFVETTLGKEMIMSIAKEAGVKIGGELYSDAMGPQGSAGETYIGMMRENVLTIVEALK
jgi:manganese/iron transport system substrate-binding protein